MSSQKGIALILVLMLSLLLSVIAFGFQYKAKNLVERYEKQQIKTELKVQMETELQALLHELSVSDLLYKNNTFKRKYKVASSNIDVAISVESYNNKVSLLDVEPYMMKQLVALFHNSALDIDEAVASFYDWIDEDNFRTRRGWESAEYARTNRSGPKNGPISSVSELLLVHGFENVSLDSLERIFTVYPVFGLDKVNADPLLLSVFFSRDIVSRIEQARSSNVYNLNYYRRVTGDESDYSDASGKFYLSINLNLIKKGIEENMSVDAKIAPYTPLPIQIYKKSNS